MRDSSFTITSRPSSSSTYRGRLASLKCRASGSTLMFFSTVRPAIPLALAWSQTDIILYLVRNLYMSWPLFWNNRYIFYKNIRINEIHINENSVLTGTSFAHYRHGNICIDNIYFPFMSYRCQTSLTLDIVLIVATKPNGYCACALHFLPNLRLSCMVLKRQLVTYPF